MEYDSWLLPEGIEELLPSQAEQMQRLERAQLDLYWRWGYERVVPPFIEFLDVLSTGVGNDLDLQTFKLTDQLTGRQMGIRADMTPQVARIDAHNLRRETPTRLCYSGTVLHTRPKEHGGSRAPLQIGLELYGHSGIESDMEVLTLMVETLSCAGISDIHIDLGHVGIFRGLVAEAGLSKGVEAALFDALQRKSISEIGIIISDSAIDSGCGEMLLGLARLNGDQGVLFEAQTLLANAPASVQMALDQLLEVSNRVVNLAQVNFHYDLAELRGYHYHTGLLFSAFVPGRGQAIAEGGRYDEIGKVFGRARAANGFSTDLRALLAHPTTIQKVIGGIFAPTGGDAALDQSIAELRASGERVVLALPGQKGGAREMECDRELVLQQGSWQVVSVRVE